MAIDFTKYGTPIQQTKSTGVDFSKYGTPVQIQEQEEQPGFLKGVARDIVRPFARAGTNIIQAGQVALGQEKTQPFSGSFLGEVKPVGQEGTFGEKLKDTFGTGLEIASNIPITRGAGLTYQGIKQGFQGGLKQGLKTLAPLAKEGAFGGGLYMTGTGLEAQKPLPEALKQGAVGTITGAVAGPLIGTPLIAAGAATKGLINLLPESITGTNKLQKLQPDINREVSELMTKTKGIIGKEQLAQRKNVDVASYLQDPVVFKGLKVEGGKVNPDDAVNVITNRIDALMNAKKELLPEVDRIMPKTSKENVRQKAIDSIRGQYAPLDEQDIITAIDRQLDVLPDELTATQLDGLRARFRRSARDAKGLQKRGSEYAALENATRDTVFDITDNLPFDTNKEYQAINNTIKDLIEVENFLDKTLRGQTVKGGRLGNLTGRTIGAIAGSKGGVLGSIIGSEIGGVVSDILTNNQLGSAFKMRMIKNLTDDPAILKVVNEFLEKAQKYNPLDKPALPAGPIAMKGRTYKQGKAQVIPATKNPVSVNPQTGKFQTTYSSSPQLSQGIEMTPKARSSIQPITSNPPNNPIKPIIPRNKKKVNNKSGKINIKTASKIGGLLTGTGLISSEISSLANELKSTLSAVNESKNNDPNLQMIIALKEAIAFNESTKNGDPYTYKKPSGKKSLGNDLGKYQITSARLKENSNRFLGRSVSEEEFLNSPEIQEQFMDAQINFLLSKDFSLAEIIATHRDGWGDMSKKTLRQKVVKRKKYTQSALRNFIKEMNYQDNEITQ